ncbi:hypothetical protein [Amycolatopsis sp. H20-H5]|uniref:hypothetical protein n=1 Tax=Amycolatopsis sp. H20-H5 TaxID=3046309 RepID=UPI002DBE99C8|nr:hypothetical protein [Amycolatopsis sp. H20-H5]MEC3977051.1 hypothetical protein [Amycolatopsis sp. H20-H5]
MSSPPQGHYPPQPPPKKHIDDLAVDHTGGGLLGGVAFAGLVKPGFFLAEDTTSAGDAAQVAQSFTNAVSSGEPFDQLLCGIRSKRT